MHENIEGILISKLYKFGNRDPPSPQLQPLHVKHDGQPRSVSNARGVPLKWVWQKIKWQITEFLNGEIKKKPMKL